MNTLNLATAAGSRKSTLALWAVLFLLFLSPVLNAHNTPIALLTLSERQQNVFYVDWTFDTTFSEAPPTAIFPAHCNPDQARLNCGQAGLYGKVSVQALGERYSAVVLRVARLDGEIHTYTLSAASPTAILTQDGVLPLREVMKSYIPLGFEHILLGIDHLLFVLGLMLLVSSRWMLVHTITAFTIAHSLTLAAVTLGWMGVPERPVNAAIALSIVFVMVEVIKHRRGIPCWSARAPWAVAFGFGLLHGFGFAGALTEVGLPPENLPAALLFFNIGVELGQLLFVFAVLLLIRCHRILMAELPRWGQTSALYGIGAIASFWFLSRVSVFFSNPPGYF